MQSWLHSLWTDPFFICFWAHYIDEAHFTSASLVVSCLTQHASRKLIVDDRRVLSDCCLCNRRKIKPCGIVIVQEIKDQEFLYCAQLEMADVSANGPADGTAAGAGDNTEATQVPKQKSAKELAKEAKRLEKLEKFKAKQEKQAQQPKKEGEVRRYIASGCIDQRCSRHSHTLNTDSDTVKFY